MFFADHCVIFNTIIDSVVAKSINYSDFADHCVIFLPNNGTVIYIQNLISASSCSDAGFWADKPASQKQKYDIQLFPCSDAGSLARKPASLHKLLTPEHSNTPEHTYQ